jgi:predicted transcriptional regulator
MKTKIHLRPLQKAQEKTSIAEVLERAKETCEYCRPLTPITCVTTCNIWKLKNELRKLHEKTENPNFMTKMLNALKNRRRLRILEILSNGRYSIVRLQQKLKKIGYHHSRRTIAEEYVNPLIEVGLVKKNNNKYHTTLLGCKLNESIKDFSAIGELLPPHSECYEEKAIKALSESPKTYEELKFLIPTESLSRVLKRLQETKLITKDHENSYIFYFKTKRNPQQERLSPTEKRVYEDIPEEGITAKKLADKTNVSLRRTYKYLRKLRGKKLAFKRKRPKAYALTREGRQIAKLLEKMHLLLIKLEQTSAEFTTQHLEPEIQQIPVPGIAENRREKPPQILIRSSV